MRFEGLETSVASFGDGLGLEGCPPPYGLFGGKQGTTNSLKVILPSGEIRNMGSKELLHRLPKGTIVEQIIGGGGGYGDPSKRERFKISDEIKNGLLSIQKACQEYGYQGPVIV
jgi:N-methylhydantoinase B